MKTRSPVYSVLVICLVICLFITLYSYIVHGSYEPFSFTDLLTSVNSDSMPESLKANLIPTDWLDWSFVELGDWSIDIGITVISLNFIRDIVSTLMQLVNTLLYLGVGLINLVPFVSWVLGHILL